MSTTSTKVASAIASALFQPVIADLAARCSTATYKNMATKAPTIPKSIFYPTPPHATWSAIPFVFGNRDDIRQHQFSPSANPASRSRSAVLPPRRTVVKSTALGRAGVDGGFFLHAASVLFFARARSATARNFVEDCQ